MNGVTVVGTGIYLVQTVQPLSLWKTEHKKSCHWFIRESGGQWSIHKQKSWCLWIPTSYQNYLMCGNEYFLSIWKQLAKQHCCLCGRSSALDASPARLGKYLWRVLSMSYNDLQPKVITSFHSSFTQQPNSRFSVIFWGLTENNSWMYSHHCVRVSN